MTLGSPFVGRDVSSAWVAPVMLANGMAAILKLGMPHMEGEQELQGLRFWNGDPTVHLLEADYKLGAMLIERCEPGTALRTLPEAEQDLVIASLLRRLWRSPSAPHPFRYHHRDSVYASHRRSGRHWPYKATTQPSGFRERRPTSLNCPEAVKWCECDGCRSRPLSQIGPGHRFSIRLRNIRQIRASKALP
jgi:hypothetical protein